MSEGLISFTDSETKAGYLVQQPYWADVKVLSFREKVSAAGDSTNYFVEFLGLAGEMKDVEFTVMFNTSKGFKGKIVRFFMACNGGSDLTPGKSYGFGDTVGLSLQGYCQRGQDKNGQPINDLADFRPLPTS